MSPNINIRNSPERLPIRYLLVHLWLVLGFAVSGCAASGAPLDPPPPSEGVPNWPVALEATEGRVEVYQPQPEAMKGDTLTARPAVSLTPPGAAAPVFGAAWF